MEANKYPQDLVLEGYGVKLKRLTHDKIELLRQWRNDPKIQQYMIYRETITPEMQEKWFQKINNDHNFYFIIEYEGKEIGCINIKDVDYEKKCGEPGIFIYDDEYLNSDVAIRASFCLGNFVWKDLNLEYEYIHIVATNHGAIKYNEMIGFKLCPEYVDKENMKFILSREDAKHPTKLIAKLKKILLN